MRYLLVLSSFILVCCVNSAESLKEICELKAKEVSGIETVAGSPYIWAIEDHGNDNVIYAFDEDGKIVKKIELADVKNNDWEDITSDNNGNLYIGDFGNNNNDRRDLAIYKLEKALLDSATANVSSVTRFHYPEQKDFPPKKSSRIFDVEAFYEYNGNFYLFTKNRSSRFDGSLNVYKVPNKPGNFAAKKIGTLTTCSQYNKCAVTGADVSQDGKTVALIASDRLWLLTGFSENDFSNATMDMFELGHHSQKEGICFKDDDTLLIADEKDDNIGGNLYSVSISALKGETKAK
jgi:hypothetical protein